MFFYILSRRKAGVYTGENIKATAFEAIGQSYGIVVTMNPPDALTATFKAFIVRQEGNQKSCTMSLKDNKLSCVISQLLPNSTYLVALEACTQDEICVAYGNSLSVRTRPGDVRPDGGLIAVSVIFAVICVLLILLVINLVHLMQKGKVTHSIPSKVEKFDDVYEGF
nr:unnamed protein product [Spirometra erinaceieuropaei]